MFFAITPSFDPEGKRTDWKKLTSPPGLTGSAILEECARFGYRTITCKTDSAPSTVGGERIKSSYILVSPGSCRSGSEPVKLLEKRERPVTFTLEASQVTPCHCAMQGSVAVFQTVVHEGPPVAKYKARRESISL